MPRTIVLRLTVPSAHPGTSEYVYAASPETRSTLGAVAVGTGTCEVPVELVVADDARWPEGSVPPVEVHSLVELYPRDKAVVYSSEGLSQRAIRELFPEVFGRQVADEPSPEVSSAGKWLNTSAGEGPVGVFMPSEGTCEWCDRPLDALFDLDLTDDGLAFLGLRGERLRVVTCPVCSIWHAVYTDVDLTGSARWSDANQRPDDLPPGPASWPAVQMAVGDPFPSPGELDELDCESLFDVVEGNDSHLGGQPQWVQYREHPNCPRCAQPMPFLGQLDLADEPFNHEGVYFAFLDTACGTAATRYQQT